MAKVEQDPVAHGVGDMAMLPVVVELLHSLGLLQPVPDVCQKLITLGHRLGHSSHTRVPRLIRPDGRRVMAVDHLEWRVVQGRLVCCVVGVLSPRKPAKPLARTVAGELAKVHGNDVVGRLRLAIRLRMKRRHHVQLGTHEPHQLLLEHGGEH